MERQLFKRGTLVLTQKQTKRPRQGTKKSEAQRPNRRREGEEDLLRLERLEIVVSIRTSQKVFSWYSFLTGIPISGSGTKTKLRTPNLSIQSIDFPGARQKDPERGIATSTFQPRKIIVFPRRLFPVKDARASAQRERRGSEISLVKALSISLYLSFDSNQKK